MFPKSPVTSKNDEDLKKCFKVITSWILSGDNLCLLNWYMLRVMEKTRSISVDPIRIDIISFAKLASNGNSSLADLGSLWYCPEPLTLKNIPHSSSICAVILSSSNPPLPSQDLTLVRVQIKLGSG
jgi:hypothetical protein